jgi:hypothetical protein
MPNTVIYNPLIKKGFQEVADTGSIETDVAQLKTNVADLQQHKITKCLIPADLLSIEEGEIIQWQGLTQTIYNVQFVKGYFYKCANQKTIIEPGTPYYHIVQDIFINPLPPIMAGDYYFVANLPKSYINNLLYCQYPQNGNYFSYNRSTPMPPRPIVGDIFFDYVNKEFVSVVDVSYPNYITLSNGVTLNDYTMGYTLDTNVIKCVAANSSEIVIAPSVSNGNSKLPLAVVSNGVVYPIVLEPYVEWQLLTTQSSVIIPPAFIRVDTQPPTPGITEENGILKVSLPVEFADDVTVKGTQTVVHTQEIESEADYIELRNGNPLGLANGERSGLEVNNYDGNNTDCILAVDNQGWARVGDSSGTLQKLATIEESPTDGGFATYNETDKELQTTKDGSSLNINFTSSAVSGNVLDGDPLSISLKKIFQNFNIFAINSLADIEALKGITTVHSVFVQNSFTLGTSGSIVTIAKYTKGIICSSGGDLVFIGISTAADFYIAYIDPTNHWQAAKML